MPSTIDYNQRAQESGLNYNSTAPLDLANFISRLYSPASIATKEYLQVRVLNFNLPFDNLASSGLLRLFGIHEAKDIKEPPPHEQLPGDLGIAASMLRSVLEAHNTPARVPIRKWWQIIVYLFKHCVNVTTIEVPPEWFEVRWYTDLGARWPRVDPQSKRQLGNARWRWGEDPEVEDTVEVLGGRSLGFE